MARVTLWLALLAFATGVAAFVVGFRVGHGESDLATHLNWGALSLLLQLFTVLVAGVHARASAREIESLRAALDQAEGRASAPR